MNSFPDTNPSNFPVDPTQFDLTTGQGRAAFRMTQKYMRLERLYAETPKLPESRQVQRKRKRQIEKVNRKQSKLIARTEKRKGNRPATATPVIADGVEA